MTLHPLIARISWIIGMLPVLAPAVMAQSKKEAHIVVEDGQDESWNYWSVDAAGIEKWLREYKQAFGRKDYHQAIAISDKYLADHVKGVGAVYLYRGIAKQKLEKYDAAASDFKTALMKGRMGNTTRDFYALCYQRLAVVCLLQRRVPEAQSYLRRAMHEAPNDPESYEAAAWYLATYHVTEVRNGAEATRLATKACELSNWKSASCLDTLAAACAETGDFASAVKWQTKAIELAKGDKSGLNMRLALYQRRQPYRSYR